MSQIENHSTLHVPRLLSNQDTPWHVIFWYFHKHVLLLACPPALVTSVWLQQSPFMSWLCLLHFVWLTSGLCLPAGHRLTLSSTSLPGRPVNEVNVPPSLVRGWHLGLYNTLCHLPPKTTEKTDIMNRLGKYRAAVRFLLKFYCCTHKMKIQTACISIFSICLVQNSDVVRCWLERGYLSTLRFLSPKGIRYNSYSHIFNAPSEQQHILSFPICV